MHKQTELKSYLTTDAWNICEGVTSTTLQQYDAFHKLVTCTNVVIACTLIQAGVTSSPADVQWSLITRSLP